MGVGRREEGDGSGEMGGRLEWGDGNGKKGVGRREWGDGGGVTRWEWADEGEEIKVRS